MSFNDREFLMYCSQWPRDHNHIPYCCLKRPSTSGLPTLGFLYGRPKATFTVLLGCIFEGGSGETIEYQNVDELLADGWVVD